jgi:phosphoglycerol transferase
VKISAHGAPRSLLLIYVESLEAGYQEPERFGSDLVPRLSALQGRHASAQRFHQAEGAHWTIAGIVASQCGVPLKVSLLPPPEDRRFGLRRFLPGARCLGDVLAERGYENVFMNGPDLAFADLGTFLRDHGYSRRYGAREWIAEGTDPDSLRHWGLRDAPLMARARSELDRLMASGKPFNLTVLTVDTHGPRGLLGAHCRERGSSDFRGIIDCLDQDVSDLLQEIERRGWLGRLSVVVLGDHIAMENPLMDQLAAGERRIFNLWMHEPTLPTDRDDILHFDWYPTLLWMTGWRAEGGRLGLGYCFLQACAAPPVPDGRLELFRKDLLNRSPRYDALWMEDPE